MVRFALQRTLPDGQYVQQNLGRLQSNSQTEMFDIADGCGDGRNPTDVNVIIVVRRVLLADTRWWQNDTRTGKFFYDDAVRSNHSLKYGWTPGQPCEQPCEATDRSDAWNEGAWWASSIWEFYSSRAGKLDIGKHRALGREHVFVFEYKAPLDGRPGDPNFRLVAHRAGILMQKRALDDEALQHYTGHNIYK